MNEATKEKKAFRKRRLFPRALGEVVNQATKPMMDKQGKLYGALIRDWAVIVGDSRARICTPQRLQFPTAEASGAVLHVNVHPAYRNELQFVLMHMVEQCARYFGYKAIERIVMHADYTQVSQADDLRKASVFADEQMSREEAKNFFAAMRANLHSGSDK